MRRGTRGRQGARRGGGGRAAPRGRSADATVPHNRPTLGKAEEAAALRALRSGWVAPGPEVAAFEEALAARVGGAAAAVSSGTAALHLALLALGVGPGDEVLLPTYACQALAHAVRYTGARPVPCDVRPHDLNLDPTDAARRRTARARAVILPHAFGTPADVETFLAWGIPVVEDCAQSLGARRAGRSVGGIGTCAVFSFGATKIMTAGGAGGAVVSRDAGIVARARDLRDYDKRADDALRFNYQMTDLAAAVGRAQLARLDGFLARRAALAAAYAEALGGTPGVSLPVARPVDAPARYRFIVRTRRPAAAVVEGLRRRGIEAIQPIAPFQMLHRVMGLRAGAFPGAEAAAREAVSLPLYPALTDVEQTRVIRALQEVLAERSG